MSKYLVTGGCGFIGSHLVRGLRDNGDEVVVLDDLSSGRRERLSPDTALVVGDIGDTALVSSLVGGVDGVFHLAAVASVARCNEAWLESHATNMTGTLSVLDAARARSTPVVWASSAAVYGDQGGELISEDAALSPLSPYGADKLACELHAKVAASLFGVPNVGLRFFNVYGPGQDPASPYSGVVSIFVDCALAGRQAVINGDGSNVRDFVYVADVVKTLLAAMASVQSRPEGGPATSKVLNVCTGRATRIDELFRLAREAVGSGPEPLHGPPRPGDIHSSIGSGVRLEQHLGVTCGTTMSEGLGYLVGSLMEGHGQAEDWRERS